MKKYSVIFMFLFLLVFSVSAFAAKPTVAIVVGDAIGDRGFTDMAYFGIQEAEKDFGITYKAFECHMDPAIYYDTLKAAASRYDVIFVVPGYFFDKELEKVIKEYPDNTYVYIDGASNLPGMVSVVFKQNEGSFLAGSLAAMLTTKTSLKMINPEKIVGFVGGSDWPVIRDYQAGFEQGVKFIDPSIKIVAKYAGTHYDPAKGKETAYIIFRDGADVIFQAAGPTGLGVLEAASSNSFYTIGVDTDQGYLQPGYIVSSMLKKVDTAVYNITEEAVNGKLEKGTTHVFNVANNGIGLAFNDYFMNIVPAGVYERIVEISEKIANGEIEVETYLK